MLRGKFITLSAHIKKVEKSHTSNLTAHLKSVEQNKADSPRNKQQEIVKLRAEINKIETNNTMNQRHKELLL